MQKVKFHLFATYSSEITHFDALSLVLWLIWYIFKSKMADQNSRQTANIKRINRNHPIHHFLLEINENHFLSTILLHELSKVE